METLEDLWQSSPPELQQAQKTLLLCTEVPHWIPAGGNGGNLFTNCVALYYLCNAANVK